ncbi:MAG: type II toxin-antitoxin system VapC family toxin [Alphaproteobacteria bacterium]|nr:type II toxin-antitoxin system VapC family toxin [Alphaproteobacteria bacterium]
MDFLLDTHVFLWWDAATGDLGREAAAAIADPDNNIFVSAASVWEIAIKQKARRLSFAGSPTEAIGRNGFLPLPVLPLHAERAAALPPLHQDPFDRMLVAQAQAASLTLITADERITAYAVPRLWAR